MIVLDSVVDKMECVPGLIRLIESTIKEEVSLRPGRPIYVMGEGYGALLAISLAARNPDVDLVLILVNPGTPLSFLFSNPFKFEVFEFSLFLLVIDCLQNSGVLSVGCTLLTKDYIKLKE